MAGQAPGADVSSADPGEQEHGAAALRRMVDATVALGSDQMNGVSYGLFGRAETAPAREAFERSAGHLGAVADYAHERGVTMTFEVLNRYETAMLNTAEQALDFIAASGSEHLRVHLDTFHMAVEEADMLAAVRSAVPVLGYLELGQSGRGPLGPGRSTRGRSYARRSGRATGGGSGWRPSRARYCRAPWMTSSRSGGSRTPMVRPSQPRRSTSFDGPRRPRGRRTEPPPDLPARRATESSGRLGVLGL